MPGQLRLKTIKYFDWRKKEAANIYIILLTQDLFQYIFNDVFQYSFKERCFQTVIYWPFKCFLNLQSFCLEARTERETALALQRQDTPVYRIVCLNCNQIVFWYVFSNKKIKIDRFWIVSKSSGFCQMREAPMFLFHFNGTISLFFRNLLPQEALSSYCVGFFFASESLRAKVFINDSIEVFETMSPQVLGSILPSGAQAIHLYFRTTIQW